MKGRTTIVIAHRLSTIRDADKIYVFSDGNIAESGTHEELISNQGLYSELVQTQFKSKSTHTDLIQDNIDHKNMEDTPDSSNSKLLNSSEERHYSAWGIIRRLAHLNKPETPFLVVGSIAALLAGFIQPVYSILFSYVVDCYYKPRREIEDSLMPWILAFVGFGLISFVLVFMQQFLLGIAGEKLTCRLRSLCFKSILQQDIQFFDKKENSSGILASKLASDATQVHNLLGPRFAVMLSTLSVIGAGLGVALYHSMGLFLWLLTYNKVGN